VTFEAALAETLGRDIVRVTRKPYAYRTTFPLDELEVELGDGTTMTLLLKDVDRRSLDDAGRAAKPEHIYDPRREIEAYGLLEGEGLGTPHLYGTLLDGERSWLLIEKVAGIELWQVGDLSTWAGVARWLAMLHARFARPFPARTLLRHDAAYFRLWAERARQAVGEELAPVLARHDAIVERLTSLPKTLIHGEFYASNILVEEEEVLRVAPVDWEMAAVGPALMDLAALTTGWSEPEQAAIESAYGFVDQRDLDCCRVQLALQWLGWSSDWAPPPEHARDWVAEARVAVERLDR
jgi:aminoglycoside phosphotransferase (APT) family kinase protein